MRPAIPAWAAAGLLAIGVLLAAAPAASGLCGDAQRFAPLTARRSPPPLAIGDSVMLGAVEPLRRAGFEVDARGCRTMDEGLELLRARRRSGSLPAVVVVALGDDLGVDVAQIARARRILGPTRVLGLVTPRGSASSQAAIRAAARRWPARVRNLDWAARSAGSSWTWDGLHLTPDGARALADLVRGAASWKPPPARRIAAGRPPVDEGGGVDRGFVAVLALVAVAGVLMAPRPPRAAG